MGAGNQRFNFFALDTPVDETYFLLCFVEKNRIILVCKSLGTITRSILARVGLNYKHL